MRRREFIAGLGSAAAWPMTARTQQAERVPRVGFLTALAENSQVFRDSTVVLREGLSKAGWVEGRNLRLDVRSAGGDANRLRASATELVSLAPDVIVTNTRAATRAVQQQTQTIPIVLLGAGDVFEIGLVKSIARPEGNITGVTNAFSSFGGKWLELLKGAVPRLARVGVVYNAQISSGIGDYFLSIKEQAPALALGVHQIQFGNAADLASGIRTFAAEPNGVSS